MRVCTSSKNRFPWATSAKKSERSWGEIFKTVVCFSVLRNGRLPQFSGRLGPNNSRLCSLNQQIPLKLGHSCNNLHCHFSCWAGEIDTANCESMYTYNSGSFCTSSMTTCGTSGLAPINSRRRSGRAESERKVSGSNRSTRSACGKSLWGNQVLPVPCGPQQEEVIDGWQKIS